LLSSVDRGTNEPDKQFLNKLKEQSKTEFLAFSTDGNKQSEKTIPISTWRIIMKSRITKLAAAAVIIIGILFAINHIGGSIDGTNTAFADMIETMKKQPWVHSSTTSVESGENILERWYGLESGISISKDYREATLLYINTQENREYTYKEKEGVIYYSQIDDSVRPSGNVPDSAFALVESMVNYINKYASEVNREVIIQDNREVELITATARMNEESIFHTLELTRDIQKNHMLSVKIDYKDPPKYILSKESEEIREQWRNSRIDSITKFDYPASGPGSIYDLGVPKDADIVVSSLPSEIQEMIVKLNSLRETTLTRYVAIAISGDSDTLPTSPEGLRNTAFFYNNDRSIYSIWRSGDFVRFSQGYFPVSENIPAIDDLSGNIEFGFQEIAPIREFIIQPEKGNQYHQYCWENIGINIRAEKTKHISYLYESDEFLIENCWPKIGVPHQQAMKWSIEYIDGQADDKLIMITRELDITTEKWYINPDKNYICQKHELFHSDGAPFKIKEILEYATTKSGKYYPRKIQMKKFRQQDNQKVHETATKIIYLKENPDYPDWIFDPDSFPESDQ